MKPSAIHFAAALLILGVSTGLAHAQPLTVGNAFGTATTADLGGPDVRTDIDTLNPASATGFLEQAKFGFGGNCPGGASIKVFRRNGDVLTLVASSGAINTVAGTNTVALTPALPIRQGDLIGITKRTACGNPTAIGSFFPQPSYLQYSGEGTTPLSYAAGQVGQDTLLVSANGTATERVTGVFPGVGSTRGGFGANFKTGLQILAPNDVSGRIYFHQTGRSGTLDDPFITFDVLDGKVQSFNDILASMGQTGIGSMTVVQPVSQDAPIFNLRVFDDGGESGTKGFSEPMIDIDSEGTFFRSSILYRGVTGNIIGPPDGAYRQNFGARALFSGATFTARLMSKDGDPIGLPFTRTLQPNEHLQVRTVDMFGTDIIGDDWISVSCGDGSVIIYASTVDNVTNDPSIQYIEAVEAVAKR